MYIRGNGAGDGDPFDCCRWCCNGLFSSFSQDEVESITILKDATAAAVYGVRCCRCYFGDYETWYSTEAYGYREFFGYFKSEYKFSGIPKWSRFLRIGTIQHSVWME